MLAHGYHKLTGDFGLKIIDATGRPLPRVVGGKVIFADGPRQDLLLTRPRFETVGFD